MNADIGPGDVVEATDDCDNLFYSFPKGTRATVQGIDRSACSCGFGFGLYLCEFPLPTSPILVSWCASFWRKIGGSQADTVRRFAEDLTPAAPATREPEPA